MGDSNSENYPHVVLQFGYRTHEASHCRGSGCRKPIGGITDYDYANASPGISKVRKHPMRAGVAQSYTT